MDRREFIGSAAVLSLPFILKGCYISSENFPFPIEVNSDHQKGHLLFQKAGTFTQGKAVSTDVVIVGGGVAGMTAAAKLQGQRDFMLFEVADRLGGTSSSRAHGSIRFAEGAHYELEYPSYYGEEVLSFLDQQNVLHYRKWKNAWTFKDSEYIIPDRKKSRAFENGNFREDVIPSSPMKSRFEELVSSFIGEMPLPSRIIPKKHHHLNNIPFHTYLTSEIGADQEFIKRMDYHMKDDWGGSCSQVSALAGIHYFACRPYYSQVVDLFSPPAGNDYFIRKFKEGSPDNAYRTQCMVERIEHVGEMVEVSIIDFSKKERTKVRANQVIYAGNKQALKYVYPESKGVFQHTQAPWMVLNFIVKNELPTPGYWQNEMLVDDTSFLGFIDSDLQHTKEQKERILTAYYCLPSSSANDLLQTEHNKEVIVEKTLQYLNAYFSKDIRGLVEKVYIRSIGHAMPIPSPGYLFKDANEVYPNSQVVFAGVDNHRLPLFLEAVDSGLCAVRKLG